MNPVPASDVDSGTTAAAMRRNRLQLLVDALGVQSLNQLRHWKFEDLTDAEQSGHGDRPTGLNLLPVARGEAKAEHIFLSEAPLLAERLHSGAQSTEKLVLICHTLICKDLRAETPRAD